MKEIVWFTIIILGMKTPHVNSKYFGNHMTDLREVL